jgi:hypothetical protein
MGNLVGLDAERLLNHPYGAVAVVAVDRLAKLGRLGNPNDGWRATVGSVPDSFCRLSATAREKKIHIPMYRSERALHATIRRSLPSYPDTSAE